MKEPENSSKEKVNEMEASNLSDGIQSNCYKDTQQCEKRIETIKNDAS